MVPDIAVVFKLDGRKLTLKYRSLPLRAWEELKQQLSLTPKTLMDGIEDWDLDAVGAVVWLERKQRERNLGWHEVRQDLMTGDHEFEVVDLQANGQSLIGEDVEEDDVDPTGAG